MQCEFLREKGDFNMSGESVLHVYTSGGVAPPAKKCAQEFTSKSGTEFEFSVGKAEELISDITKSKEGDILTCGAEFILDDAQERGLILGDTRRSLGYRRTALLVPAGNPGKIETISDLAREGVKVGVSSGGCLLGVWDEVASRAGLTDQIRRNITDYADGCGALMALVNQKKVDAGIGWDAFARIWARTAEAVELPEKLQVYRSTGIGVISFSKNTELANDFISFLSSDPCKRIYEEHGWYHAIP